MQEDKEHQLAMTVMLARAWRLDPNNKKLVNPRRVDVPKGKSVHKVIDWEEGPDEWDTIAADLLGTAGADVLGKRHLCVFQNHELTGDSEIVGIPEKEDLVYIGEWEIWIRQDSKWFGVYMIGGPGGHYWKLIPDDVIPKFKLVSFFEAN